MIKEIIKIIKTKREQNVYPWFYYIKIFYIIYFSYYKSRACLFEDKLEKSQGYKEYHNNYSSL